MLDDNQPQQAQPVQQQQYSMQEFAGKVRAKYPGSYDHISDEELTGAMLKKYPVYAGQVKMPALGAPQTASPPSRNAWQTSNTPTPDLLYGSPGITSDALTYVGTGGKYLSTEDLRQKSISLPAKDATTPPSWGEKLAEGTFGLPKDAQQYTHNFAQSLVGQVTADIHDFGASLTSPLAVATMGLNKWLGAAKASTAVRGAELEEQMTISQSLRAGGAAPEVVQKSAQDVLATRASLRSAERNLAAARASTGVVSTGFAASGAVQSYEAIDRYKKKEISGLDAFKQVGEGAGFGLSGTAGMAHSVSGTEIPVSPIPLADKPSAAKSQIFGIPIVEKGETSSVNKDTLYLHYGVLDDNIPQLEKEGLIESVTPKKRLFESLRKSQEPTFKISDPDKLEARANSINFPSLQEERSTALAPEAISKEQDLFSQAKQSWIEKNPSGDPSSTGAISAIATEAQRLKTGDSKPVGSAPIDLREMSSEARHDWINKNAPVALNAADLEGAQKVAKTVFGEGDHPIVSFIDKNGNQKFGMRYRVSEPTASPTYGDTFAETQKLENLILERTNGQGKELLDALAKNAKDALPSGSKEDVLNLYNQAARKLYQGLVSGKADASRQAFDIAAKKSEKGALGPQRPPLTPQQSELLAKVHVDVSLHKWEQMTDTELLGAKVRSKVLDPTFENSVSGANDPKLQARYDILLDRIGGAKYVDPIRALNRTFGSTTLASGQLTRGMLRESLGQAARSREMNAKSLESYISDWNSRPLKDSIHFIDSIETGDINNIVDPVDQDIAKKLRDMLDTKRDEVQALGTGKLDDFNASYFPHMWKFGVSDMAQQIMQGRRPFQGGASFLKQRTYQTFADGIADGMEPVTYNPIQMALLKMHEMDRYLMANRVFGEMKSTGMIRQFGSKEVPLGWTQVNDKLFGSKAFVTEDATTGDPRVGLSKAWYAPWDAARVINNHLSPGLRGNALFNSFGHYNNILNQANLGISAFHGIETAFNASVSEAGLGLLKVSRGKVLSGLADVIKSPTAPLTHYLLGDKILKEYMEPGRYSKVADLAKAVETAGGRVSLGREYRNMATESLRNSWKELQNDQGLKKLGSAGKVAYNAVGTVLEKLSAPIMEHWVPRLKLGAFAREAQFTMERLGPNAPPEVIRQELGKAWDSIDNRHGQVVYDNLFWNRTYKDLAHLTIRSVGWNMGTARELGGSVLDLGGTAKGLAKGQGLQLTTRQTYTLALLGYTALTGYLINHFYGQKVNEATDLLYPKNGKINPDGTSQRIYLKTYVHDAYTFYHHPGTTAVNKAAPIWHQAGELYGNADFYGNRIRPVGGSLAENAAALGKYTLSSAEPFSVRNFQQRRAEGEGILGSLTSATAILPAPKWIGQSKASAMAYEFYKSKMPAGPNDPATEDRVRFFHQLASGYAAGQFTDSDIDKAVDEGKISMQQAIRIGKDKDGQLSPLLRHAKTFTPQEMLRVWDAATDSEKADLEPVFDSKWNKIGELNLPQKDAEALDSKFRSASEAFAKINTHKNETK